MLFTLDARYADQRLLSSGSAATGGHLRAYTRSLGLLAVLLALPAGAAAQADFNGDGHPDIFWGNTATGQHAVWLMNGAAAPVGALAVYPTVTDTAWRVVAVADFTGDSKPDLLWRNSTTGQNVVWQMNGLTFVSQTLLPTVADADWRIVGAADMTGDGRPDILWRNTSTGFNVVWTMNGLNFVSQTLLPAVPDVDWEIRAVGDVDGNGHPDLVWRNVSTGYNVVWFMNRTTFDSQSLLPTISDGFWDIRAAADFNGDGTADLVWQSWSGTVVIWYLNGATFLNQVLVGRVVDRDWEIRTPSPGSLPWTTATLSRRAVYFGHQSVGYNIVSGAQALVGNWLWFRETTNPFFVFEGVFAHSSNGSNGDPKGKTAAFAATIRGGVGARANIAFFKYCYVDISSSTNVADVFADYQSTMAALKSEYPNVHFVHVTAPLMTGANSDNPHRETFNNLMRQAYAGVEPVFDLAKIESTRPDGTSETYNGVRALVASYSSDGGHLNTTGSDVVAKALLRFLAGL